MKKKTAVTVAAVLLVGAGAALIAGQLIVAGILVVLAAVGLVVWGR